MRVVLLTGPIGSGKSEVAKYLANKGIAVYDCDSAVKSLYENVPGLKDRIERELEIPFANLSLVFSDEGKREKLEKIVYPLLLQDINRWKENCSGTCFIESAIALSKREFDGVYDAVLMIDAPYEIRLKRNPKAASRDKLQSFDLSKVNTIIINDSTVKELYIKIDKYLWQQI